MTWIATLKQTYYHIIIMLPLGFMFAIAVLPSNGEMTRHLSSWCEIRHLYRIIMLHAIEIGRQGELSSSLINSRITKWQTYPDN